jgi:hypothetical protein
MEDKLVEQWEKYKRLVYPNSISKEEEEEISQAFFVGALEVIEKISSLESIEEVIQYLKDTNLELITLLKLETIENEH